MFTPPSQVSATTTTYSNEYLCIIYGDFAPPSSADITIIHLPNMPPSVLLSYATDTTAHRVPRNKSDVSLATVKELLISCYNLADLTLLGIEILPPFDPRPSYTLATLPQFTSPRLLMLGNEGSGMTEKQIGLCDEFVVVEQYGGSTASFNVNVAYNIISERLRARAM